MVNVPLGDVLAFRASAKYDYEPGWINVFGPEERTSNTACTVFRCSPTPPIR